jgi:hypothetical protein
MIPNYCDKDYQPNQFRSKAPTFARILGGIVLVTLCAVAEANSPEELLTDYATAVQAGNYDNLASLFSTDARGKVKAVFKDVLLHELDSGGYKLQQRIFNRKVTRQEVEATSEALYLSLLMTKLVDSTQQQGVKMDRVEIIGRIDETTDMAHLLVRVFMSQRDTPFNNLQVFSFSRVDGNWGMEIPTLMKQVLEMLHYSTQR